MMQPHRLGKFATIAILPLMAIVIVIAAKAAGRASPAVEPPRAGLLVVANLRGESLTLFDASVGFAPRTLSLPGPPHEMVEAGGRLYVTLGRANAVVEVDPGAPGVLRSLALEGEPHGIAVQDDRLLVTLDKRAAVVTVDRATLAEVGRAATGDTPHGVASEGEAVYVTESRDDRLVCAGSGSLDAGTGAMPESVVVIGDYVVTADAEGGSLSVFRREGLRPAGRVHVGGAPVRVIALGESRVAAALNGSAKVAVIDVARTKVERTVQTAGHPDGLCLDPSGKYLAVASNEAGTVQVFRVADWASAPAVPAGDGPGACAWLASR